MPSELPNRTILTEPASVYRCTWSASFPSWILKKTYCYFGLFSRAVFQEIIKTWCTSRQFTNTRPSRRVPEEPRWSWLAPLCFLCSCAPLSSPTPDLKTVSIKWSHNCRHIYMFAFSFVYGSGTTCFGRIWIVNCERNSFKVCKNILYVYEDVMGLNVIKKIGRDVPKNINIFFFFVRKMLSFTLYFPFKLKKWQYLSMGLPHIMRHIFLEFSKSIYLKIYYLNLLWYY